jgi:cellulose synthase (UDP-forming)
MLFALTLSANKKRPVLSNPATSTKKPYRLHYRSASGILTMRLLVAAGVFCLGNFLWWAINSSHRGYLPLFVLLLISLGFKALRMAHEWVHYVRVSVPVLPTYTPALRTVDVLTTACPGEPHAMIIETLEAMQAIRYPHTSYLCDEGNDPVLRAACARLGVVHVTRTLKVNAKAGNINNALRQATGEMCVVLDPDHVPTPDFLDKVMPYFEDEKVGYVQVVQAYGNQSESLVARGAAEQTYHFYGPLMMSMNRYGTVQAIGANCTFRRKALDSIGGHAPGLTEDMHTAMLLHAAGWESAYVPEIVSRGLVPASLAAFYAQQLKWSRGTFDLLFRVYPKLVKNFSWPQRLHYFVLPLYFFSGVVALIDLLLPLFSLGLSQFPWLVNMNELLYRAVPLLAMSMLIRLYAQRWLREPSESGLHLAGGFLRMGTWWVYTLGFLYAVVGKRVPYIPTPKEGRCDNEWRLALPNLTLAVMLLAACKYARVTAFGTYTNTMVFLALINVAILLAATIMGQHMMLRNFMTDMATRPFRWIGQSLNWLHNLAANLLVPRLRQAIVPVMLTSLGAAGTLLYTHSLQMAHIPPEWMLAGTQTVRVGQTLTPAQQQEASSFAWLWSSQQPTSDCAITALTLPNFDPNAPLPAVVSNLSRQKQIPMLSWTADVKATMQKDYWRNMVEEVNSVPGPVLLRPRLVGASADEYRRAWRHMHTVFKAAHAVNVVWTWTPEVSDTLMQRFPGIVYTNWIASPLEAADGAPSYLTLRHRLTYDLALHQVPVVLLAPAPTGSPLHTAQQMAAEYPELSTIVFAAPTPARDRPRTPPNAHHYDQLAVGY